MKKVLIALLLCVCLLPLQVFAETENVIEEGWNIIVDGNKLGLKNAPIIENDRALAAAQALCKELGAAYTYENGILNVNDGEIVFTAGSNKCLVNSVEKALEVVPKEIDSELFVPVRFLAEQLGYQVGFTQEMSADGERVFASIVLINPAQVVFNLLLPEGQTQQQQVATLAATISNVELTILNAPNDQYGDWGTVILVSEDPAVIYEAEGYSIDNIEQFDLFYDLTSYIESFAPETKELIQQNKDIQQAVTAKNGAIIAWPIQFGEKVEQFYIPLTIEEPAKVAQFIHAYGILAKELMVK